MHRFVIACLLLCLAGCETVVRSTEGGRTTLHQVNDDPTAYEKTEDELLRITEERSGDSRAWWQLGDFYERHQRIPEAISAYQNMQLAMDKDAKRTGITYVGGYYLLAKNHARIRQWQAAIHYCEKVVEAQPEDVRKAIGTPAFKEAHYLLGAIYVEHRMFELAEKHLLTFKELAGGDHRADALLIEVEDALRPEARYEKRGVRPPAEDEQE